MSKMMDKWLQKAKTADQGLTRPPVSVSVSAHKSMDKDYTKDYPQEDGLRGLEETVQTVESTFHAGSVWTVWVDKWFVTHSIWVRRRGDVVRKLLSTHSACLGM